MLQRDAHGRHSNMSVKKVISGSGSGLGNLNHGYARKLHGMQSLYGPSSKKTSFTYSSKSTDMGFSDIHTYQSAMWEDTYLPLLEDSYGNTLVMDTPMTSPSSDTYYVPHPEALDPFSQSYYINMQWVRTCNGGGSSPTAEPN